MLHSRNHLSTPLRIPICFSFRPYKRGGGYNNTSSSTYPVLSLHLTATAPSSLIQRLRQTRRKVPAPQLLQLLVRAHLRDPAVFHYEDDVCVADRAPGVTSCQRSFFSRIRRERKEKMKRERGHTHSLCATAIVVLVMAASSSALCTTRSLCVSSADVASSSSNNLGSLTNALAIAIRCL